MFVFTPLGVRQLYGSHFFQLPTDREQNPVAEKEEIAQFSEEEVKPVDKPITPEQPKTPSIPEPVVSPISPPPVTASPFEGTAKISWKMRATAKIALILTASDFQNRFLLNGLRFLVEDAQIPKEWIGFGVLPIDANAWDIQDMTTPVGLFFHPVPSLLTHEIAGKKIYIFDDLLTVATQTDQQNTLKEILMQCKTQLQT